MDQLLKFIHADDFAGLVQQLKRQPELQLQLQRLIKEALRLDKAAFADQLLAHAQQLERRTG